MSNITSFGVLLFTLYIYGCNGNGDHIPPDPPPPVTEKIKTILATPLSVKHLAMDGNAQLAATTQGLYWRADSSADWQFRSPTETAVTGIVILGSNQYLVAAAREDTADTSAPYPLYISENQGETWRLITHNFGDDYNDPILGLAYDESSDMIYAISFTALAVANPNASNWTLMHGYWDGFASGLALLRVDNIKQSIWFGGQGAIENGYFSRYDLITDTVTSWEDLLPNPSTFKGGLIHPTDSSTVIFSGEGGIVLSTDYGISWSMPMGDVDHKFYFDVVIDDAATLYTAQWQKIGSEQPLIIECSKDNGNTWVSNNFSSEVTRGGVISLMIFTENDKTWLYLGLSDNGIKAVDIADLQCE